MGTLGATGAGTKVHGVTASALVWARTLGLIHIFFQASTDLLSRHYSDLSDRPFYPGLIKYMASGPVVPMVWSGPPGVIKTVRTMMGATMPADAVPGTIRGDLCIVPGR